MLRLLRIRDFALIKELEIEFGHGLNVLTGETGSGKSILVDAFGIMLGARSSQEMIRSGCDAAILEGMFEVELNEPITRILKEAGFEDEENLLLIRREITSAGRGRVFINGHLSTLNLLKSLGENLADIHGQQDQKSLLDMQTHLLWLDYYGENGQRLKKVRKCFKTLRETARRLEHFEADKQDRIRRIEVLRFQLEEIRSIDPLPDEREGLEKEMGILSNSEKILALATEAYAALYESESSILMGMRRLEQVLQSLENYDVRWTPHRESLQECFYRLEDIALSARDYASRCDFSSERLEQVQQRLYALEKLAQKYCSAGENILDYADDCSRELDALTTSAETSAELSGKLEADLERYTEYAAKLSEKRRTDASNLEKAIKKEFAALAMPRMEMKVQFHPNRKDMDKGLVPGSCGPHGIDHVEFFIAPNEGEAMRPLSRIASGGELSRLMLAIKSLCGKDDVGKILVFDEVDAGIGGRVAEAVGKRLKNLSRCNQVLCVTHLPQIAVFAKNHFSVYKHVVDNRTETVAKPLTPSERIQEISRMMGGEIITETTRRHAAEMLERSAGMEKRDGDVS
jgi:DNA repair protein RecN (Recombination protein N)